MSSWLLIIFVIGLSVIWGVSRQILEMFFPHLYSFFLAGSFIFALEMFFLLLTSFTVSMLFEIA